MAVGEAGAEGGIDALLTQTNNAHDHCPCLLPTLSIAAAPTSELSTSASFAMEALLELVISSFFSPHTCTMCHDSRAAGPSAAEQVSG